jgi:3-hydroxyacyl-CoA dehydrogenase
MQRLKPEVDIVKDILEAALAAQPESAFIKSLLHQYLERGGLSKKQLQGLYSKAEKVSSVSHAKLATLEAIILRKHQKHRSALPAPAPLFTKNEETGKKLAEILEKFPAHKRILFLKTKFDNNEIIVSSELTELEKIYKLLIHGK